MPALDLEKRRIIQEGYQSGLPVAEIARAAGTTPLGVQLAARRMRLRHPAAPVKSEDSEQQDRFSAQYANWQRARLGAAATLRSLAK